MLIVGSVSKTGSFENIGNQAFLKQSHISSKRLRLFGILQSASINLESFVALVKWSLLLVINCRANSKTIKNDAVFLLCVKEL